MKKQEIIDWLVDDDVNTVESMIQDGDTNYIDSIFRSGFKGYQNYTVAELRQEYAERRS